MRLTLEDIAVDPIEFATGRLPEDRKTAELAMRSKDEWRAFADAASRPPLPEGGAG